MSKAHVAIIPFKTNNLTSSVTPLKFYEYCSGGIPVVTTMLPDLIGQGDTKVSTNYQEFLHNIDHYINLTNKEYEKSSKGFLNTAKQYDWNILFSPLIDYIKDEELTCITRKDFLNNTIMRYKHYWGSKVIRNELLSIYNSLQMYGSSVSLYKWVDIKNGNDYIDYNQLSLAYLKKGEIEKAIKLIEIYIDNHKRLCVYNDYLIQIKQSPLKDRLIEAFILKLCGKHREALIY